jgi:hypothetical protein
MPPIAQSRQVALLAILLGELDVRVVVLVLIELLADPIDVLGFDQKMCVI